MYQTEAPVRCFSIASLPSPTSGIAQMTNHLSGSLGSPSVDPFNPLKHYPSNCAEVETKSSRTPPKVSPINPFDPYYIPKRHPGELYSSQDVHKNATNSSTNPHFLSYQTTRPESPRSYHSDRADVLFRTSGIDPYLTDSDPSPIVDESPRNGSVNPFHHDTNKRLSSNCRGSPSNLPCGSSKLYRVHYPRSQTYLDEGGFKVIHLEDFHQGLIDFPTSIK